MTETVIDYGHWRTGINGFSDRLRQLADTYRPATVCEVGGGAKPNFTLDEVGERGMRYVVLDIDQGELDKAPDGYDKVLGDITDPGTPKGLEGSYDFMFSYMVAEHVKHPEQFHRNVFDMLAPGGVAAHFMPTMYDPMFIANRMMPESLSRKIVAKAQPTRRLHTNQAKFPAYYRWCRGPAPRFVSKLESVGFDVVHATGYFGTGYLMRTPLNRPYEKVTETLIQRPVNALCSYTWLVLQKPA